MHANHAGEDLTLRQDTAWCVTLYSVTSGKTEITVLAESWNPEMTEALHTLWNVAEATV